MKHYAAFMLTVLLAACSSSPATNREQTAPPTTFGTSQTDTHPLTTGFSGSGLKIEYLWGGDWKKITSTSTAPILSSLPSAVDQATTVATMKARREISEFLNVRIYSKRTLKTISDNVQKIGSQDESDADASPQVADQIAQRVVESITQSSQAILRGTVVDSEYVDVEKRIVTVTISADRDRVKAAWQNR